MQYCIEEFVAADFAENGDDIRRAIAEARSWDVSYLPKKMADATTEGFDQAEASFDLLANVAVAEAAVNEASGEFRPLHRQVRQIEQDARKIEERIKEIKVLAGRLRDPSQAERKAGLEERMATLEAEKEALLARIPAGWNEAYDGFNKLVIAERNARRDYRRAVDQAYEPVVALKAALADVDGLRALEGDLAAMRDRVGSATVDEIEEPLKELARQFGAVEGGSAVKSAISKARRALTAKNQDREKAVVQMAEAVNLLTNELGWLDRASKELAPAVETYESAIRATIGVRQQPKLTRSQALYVAACNAGHRDISLNF